MPSYFEKDNKVSARGSKGDSSSECDEWREIISIMFGDEMKDETEKRWHKNADFYKELTRTVGRRTVLFW